VPTAIVATVRTSAYMKWRSRIVVTALES
jgi:hypothetical protein